MRLRTAQNRGGVPVCLLPKELTREMAVISYKKTLPCRGQFPYQAYALAPTRARSPHPQPHVRTRPSHQGKNHTCAAGLDPDPRLLPAENSGTRDQVEVASLAQGVSSPGSVVRYGAGSRVVQFMCSRGAAFRNTPRICVRDCRRRWRSLRSRS